MLDSGIPADHIMIAGDSAGGTLAVGLALSLRDSKKPMPAALVCLSPALDLTFSSETWTRNAKSDLMLEFKKEKAGVDLYLAGADPRDPKISPLFAELWGLPPILIQVGSAETLLDDALGFTKKARTAGVDVIQEIWQDIQHEWQFAIDILPEARRALAGIGNFIRRYCR